MVLVCIGIFYFAGIGMLAPVLPRYVTNELGGSGADVGLVVGAFGLSALLLRSWMGRLGDRYGRRVLIVGGCAVLGVSFLGYGIGSLTGLIALRLLSGAGEAAAIVGAVTLAEDLAPEGRSGQAAGYFSVSLSIGIMGSVPLGEWMYQRYGTDQVWLTAGLLCLVAAALGAALPAWTRPEAAAGDAPPRRFLHPAAVRPGFVLALGVIGACAFSTFVPLYADAIGMDSAATVFIVYAAAVMVVRLLGSRVPDLLGPSRGPAVALSVEIVALVAMGLWTSPTGLYVSTTVFALGSSLLYPSLMPVVVRASRPSERSHALGTLVLFFDLPFTVGAPVLGLLVEASSERWAFIAAAGAAAAGWILHRATCARGGYAAPVARQTPAATPEPTAA